MNTVTAVFIAIVAGIAAALYAYGLKESVKSHRGLALLRFIWTALLVYALVSRPISTEKTLDIQSPVSVLVDSSSSVKEDVSAHLEKLQQTLQNKGVPFVVKDYNANEIPEQSHWLYLGDGHVDGIEATSNAPIAAIMVEAKDLLPLPLISGVSVPQKVMEGSLISGRVLADQDVDIQVVSGTSRSTGHKFELKAQGNAGLQKVTVFAKRGEQRDTSRLIIEVVENYSTWLLVSEAPHPVEGMIRRYARKNGIEVLVFKPDEFKDAWSGPAVILSSGAVLDEKIAALCAGPTWKVSRSVPVESKFRKSFTVRNLPTGDETKSVRLRVSRKEAELRIGAKSIESRGIDWYASSLESDQNYALFERLCQSLEIWNTPLRIELNMPQRVFANQSYSLATALIGADNRPISTTMAAELYRERNLVDRPQLQRNELGFEWRETWKVPGNYELRLEATYGNQSITARKSFEVLPLDAERIRPFNNGLWESWAKVEGTRVLEASEDWEEELSFPSKRIQVQQKNPQHNTWWYWGLCLFFAATEWLLRRRRGMV